MRGNGAAWARIGFQFGHRKNVEVDSEVFPVYKGYSRLKSLHNSLFLKETAAEDPAGIAPGSFSENQATLLQPGISHIPLTSHSKTSHYISIDSVALFAITKTNFQHEVYDQ